MSPPISMGLGLSLSEVRTIAAGGAAAADWELVSSQDLNDGGGPYTEVSFQSLELGQRYLLVAEKLKYTAANATAPRLRMLYGATQYTTANTYGRSFDGQITDLTTGANGPVSSIGTDSYLRISHLGLVDNSATYDDLDGLNIVFDFYLQDSGTVDTQGLGYMQYMSGTMYSAVAYQASIFGFGGIMNTTPANQFDGLLFYAPVSSFAEHAGSSVSLFKYTGGIG